MKGKQATYWIERLRVIPHPEGGYCRELSDREEGELQVTLDLVLGLPHN